MFARKAAAMRAAICVLLLLLGALAQDAPVDASALKKEIAALKKAAQAQSKAYDGMTAKLEACTRDLAAQTQAASAAEARAAAAAKDLQVESAQAAKAGAALAEAQKQANALGEQLHAERREAERLKAGTAELRSMEGKLASVTEQLKRAQERLSGMHQHWLPIWLHETHDRVLRATDPIVVFYRKEIASGKAYGQARAHADAFASKAEAFAVQQGHAAYDLAQQGRRKLETTDFGKKALQAYDQALLHVRAATHKAKSHVDSVLSHPQVRGAVAFSVAQYQRVEGDLARMAAHALERSPATAPYAHVDVTRVPVRALLSLAPLAALAALLRSRRRRQSTAPPRKADAARRKKGSSSAQPSRSH